MNIKYLPFQSPQVRISPMKILVCPSGFKESLEPQVAADCIERGILRVVPNAIITKIPFVDGGEGFVKTLVAVTGGELRPVTVMGPVVRPVESYFGFLGHSSPRTAVIEMAAAAGLRLVPHGHRDPTRTTTYGVGQTILAALEAGAEHILLGCGDSGTCDGGVGMAQALGARFFNTQGEEIPAASGGKALAQLHSVDLTGLHPLLQQVKIDVACNWNNVLCGPKGVARVFGPQKGASQADVEDLAAAMETCADIFSKSTGCDISLTPGSGASGGLGAGLILIGATLHPRYDIVTKFLQIDNHLQSCDLVFTAEGGLDYQTPQGKVPAEVAARAKRRGLPVIALAGTIGQNADVNYEIGIDAFASIVQRPITLEDAMKSVEQLLTDCAESAMRMVTIGRSLRLNQSSVLEPAAEMSTVTSVLDHAQAQEESSLVST